MIDDLLQIIVMTALAVTALLVIVTAFDNYSTPSVCRAAEAALRNPGSEIIVYGKIKTWQDERYVYFSCGLIVNKSQVVVEKTTGRLKVESTADGHLYIK